MQESKPALHSWEWVMLVSLTIIAYVLRTISAHSSVAYFTDTQIVRQAFQLGEMLSSGSLAGTESFKYPLTLSVYLLLAYGAVFIISLVTGTAHSISDFAMLAVTQREMMHLIAVYTLGLINAGAVPITFVLAKRLNGLHRGWITAALVTFNLLLIQFGSQPRPHVPLGTLWLLTILLLLLSVSEERRRALTLGATILTALTIGTLQNGLVILVPYLAAWMIHAAHWRNQESRSAWFIPETIGNLVMLTVAVLILYPGIVTDFGDLVLSLITNSSQIQLAGGTHNVNVEGFRLSAILGNIEQLWNYEPLLTMGALAALPFVVWRLRNRPGTLAILLPFP